MLKQKIEEYCQKSGKKIVEFISEINISVGTYYNRMQNNEWTLSEIRQLQKVLQLTDYELLILIKGEK
jgi:hypothetical protein